MKRNRCVLKTICALILLSPFAFIQAPTESLGAHQLAAQQITFPEPQVLPAGAGEPATLVCFFSHGIADTYRQAQKYVQQYEDHNGQIHTNSRYTITAPTRAFNYPDATQRFWRVNFWRTNLGQDQDVLTLKRALERLKQQDPSVEVVLYGVSRGASTIINFLAEYGTDPFPRYDCKQSLGMIGREKLRASGNLPRIKAVVLESPYDDMASVARHLAQRTYIDKLPYCRDYGHQAVHSIIGTIFINYNKKGLSPIKSVPKIPKDIPLLIICSEQDQLVPWHSSYAIYQELKNTGHEHAHVLKLKKGLHAKLISGPEGDCYQQAVHSFYKQYGLPYNKNFLVTSPKSKILHN